MSKQDKFGGGEKLEQFRAAVRQEFGRNLEKATPANVREFMDRYQNDIFDGTVRGRLVLNEPKTTYEEILKDFFIRVLERPTEDALILLWSLAFEMSFYAIEQHAGDRFHSLFSDMGDENS